MVTKKKSSTKKKPRANTHISTMSLIEGFSIKATRWIGSVPSLIVHTCLFVGAFSFILFWVSLEKVLLVLTTLLSFEAIYLSIFIQMSVNRQENAIKEVGEELEELSDDIEDIQEDIDEISEEIEELSDDIEELSDDIEDIQEDIDEISEEIVEDVED